jgi:two-component system phosphate regulon sensor histidine kinase PhoR
MWPALALIVFAGGVLLHFWWRKRFAELERHNLSQRREIAALQEQQQRTAAQARAQQGALFNSMMEGVLLLEANGRIQLANQALQELLGFSHDILGKTVLEAFRLHELTEVIDRVAREGQVLGFELELPVLNKRCLQVNAAAILDEEKRLQGIMLVFHDLTRLKQLENTRREFVANVSHELRTPLSLIKGYVETLMEGAKDDPAVAPRFLQIIDKHADRLTFLIEDLLTISQLESGQTAMNFQRVELASLTERVLEDLRARANDKSQVLENKVPESLFAKADADRLQQVLFNLVDNAIKYGRTGGRALVAAVAREDGMIEVSVQDDGPGIPAEALERVFERFYRVDRARSREQGGTGLGLSIVKHIVQSHGGEVWAKSEIGQGSTFYFTLVPE